jgi:hypothetical protein
LAVEDEQAGWVRITSPAGELLANTSLFSKRISGCSFKYVCMYVAEFTLLVSHGNVVHCFFHRRMGEAQG